MGEMMKDRMTDYKDYLDRFAAFRNSATNGEPMSFEVFCAAADRWDREYRAAWDQERANLSLSTVGGVPAVVQELEYLLVV